MRPLVVAHGTWSRADLWCQPHSDLFREARGWGFEPIAFKWSGILGGVRGFLEPHLMKGGDPDEADIGGDTSELLLWLDAGEKLALFCRAHGLEAPDALVHSHARQVLIYAAAKGQRFGTVVDISGPIRHDVERAHRKGRGNIARWIRYYDPINDLTIRSGQLFDGEVSLDLRDEHADVNVETPGAGHSGLVIDPDLRARYWVWEQLGG